MTMRVLQQHDAVLLIDLSNFTARALMVAGEDGFVKLYCRMLQKIRRRHPDHRLVFAVEGAGTLRRQRIVPEYKGGRVPTPEFQAARNTAKRICGFLECRVIKASDGEADDAIGVYCAQHPEDDIVILSDDRDLWQLIRSGVRVESRVKNAVVQVDRFACRRLLGVAPDTIPLMKALLGDKSDCIPRGVERVHQKKLLRLAEEADGAVEKIPAIIEPADWLTDLDRRKIAAAHEVVKRQLQATRIWNDLPLKTKEHHADVDELHKFLGWCGLTRVFSKKEVAEIAGMRRSG